MQKPTIKYVLNLTYETPLKDRHCIQRTFYIDESADQAKEIERMKHIYDHMFSKIVKVNVKCVEKTNSNEKMI